MSITNKILLTDMLDGTIPTHLITGIIVLHAEEVHPASSIAFMTRMYRQANKDGFLKAFSDNAESFATGLSPLQTVMGELRIRKVELWPRFHKSIIRDLGQRKADVVELHQPLTRSMQNIQNAIVECLDTTLNELKRIAGGVDIDNYNLDNAIFNAFDITVTRQLQSRWSSLTPRSKGLVSDLATLRRLLNYLVSYSCVDFHEYLQNERAAQRKYADGAFAQNQSPWMFLDAANVLFTQVKARVYVGEIENEQQRAEREARERAEDEARAAEEEEDAAFNVDLEEEEAAFGNGNGANPRPRPLKRPRRPRRPYWLPHGIDPVLEEQPKWHLLREVLDEIEQEIHFTEDKADVFAPNNTVLIMTSDGNSCRQVRQFLETMKPSVIGQPDEEEEDPEQHDVEAEDAGRPGRKMMMGRLKRYFKYQHSVSTVTTNLRLGPEQDAGEASAAESSRTGGGGAAENNNNTSNPTTAFESDALKRKQIWERGQGPPNKRRRQRGGGAVGSAPSRAPTDPENQAEQVTKEADDMAAFIERSLRTIQEGDAAYEQLDEQDDENDDEDDVAETIGIPDEDGDFSITGSNLADEFSEVEFDNFFGVLDMDTLIVVRPYRGDGDDWVLSELRPRFIIMYDPDPAFVRRIEMYRVTTPLANPRVYFLMYAASVEEQKYLSSLRREKESFEKLIREKSTMALPLQADNEPANQSADDRMLRTVNSRIAGGQKGVTNRPPTVIMDVRELGSSLPGLLHKAGIHIEPCTLGVGDYVLSPEMVVERKSLSDLISSFKDGRLATQVEMMSVHYQHPILLIEFATEEEFNLSTLLDVKSNSSNNSSKQLRDRELTIQEKLVILTLNNPRLRIIWSASPHHTSAIFAELKATYDEPDKVKAARIGAPVDDDGNADGGEADGGGGAGAAEAAGRPGASGTGTGTYETVYNLIPDSILRSMPGLNTTSCRHVMNQVRDLQDLCELECDEVQAILGTEPGRKLWNFVQWDVKASRRGRGAARGAARGGGRGGASWGSRGGGRGGS